MGTLHWGAIGHKFRYRGLDMRFRGVRFPRCVTLRVIRLSRVFLWLLALPALGQLPIEPTKTTTIWPDLAPGESSRETGELLPFRPQEKPPVSRVVNIRLPTVDVFPAKQPNGVGVLILPGGGFGKVVPDKEGSEAAAILNQLGISAFVLRYRTKLESTDPGWRRPLQDSQRAVNWLRSKASDYKLDKDRIGLLGFSAGGQVAARLLTDGGKLAYEPVDATDDISHRPDFGILIYPWNMYDKKTDSLVPEIKVTNGVPPTFIVHTHDDASTSLGSVLFYAGLKRAGVDAELHVYRNGGHGYGTRPVKSSLIGTWPDRMVDWLKNRKLGE